MGPAHKWLFVLPLAGVAAWYGMLIAMLICWSAEGKPIYHFMNQTNTFVYISNIGAVNLQPLFIVGTSVQGIFYVLTLCAIVYTRKHQTRRAPALEKSKHGIEVAVVMISASIVSNLSVVLCSCFKVDKFKTAHYTFVAFFIGGCSVACLCMSYLDVVAYKDCKTAASDADNANIESQKSDNSESAEPPVNLFRLRLYIVSKFVWGLVGVAFILLFGVSKLKGKRFISELFEWVSAFWYGVWLLLLCVELLGLVF